MPDITWGILQPLEQTNPIRTSMPQVGAAPNTPPMSGNPQSGGILSQFTGTKNLLNSIFGTNPVQQANSALNTSLAASSPSQIASNLTPGSFTPVQNQTSNQLISQIQQAAKEQFPNNMTMQQLAVAQAAQESNLMGAPSQLASKYNNLYGMKGQGNAGSANMRSNEVIDGQNEKIKSSFAAYSSPSDSVAAWAHLMQNPRYKAVLAANNIHDAAAALQKAGYATDPNYANSITNISSKLSQTNAIERASVASKNPNASAYDVAQSYVGFGRNNHTEVLQDFFSKSMGEKVNPQTTPWCAAFANSVLMNTGHGGTGSLAAKSFLNYGSPTDTPSQGDVVVLNRGNDPSLGHVGFFAGYEDNGSKVKILGGNQSGEVSIKAYPTSAVAGYRTPPTAEELQSGSQNPNEAPVMQSTSSRQPQSSSGGVLGGFANMLSNIGE